MPIIVIAGAMPKINAPMSTTAPDRSTLRNGGMNGIGNSKYIIMIAIAANTAVQVIFFAFVITASPLRVLFSVC